MPPEMPPSRRWPGTHAQPNLHTGAGDMSEPRPEGREDDPGDPIRIFVGADDYQLLGAKVLEASIKRRTKHSIQFQTMNDLSLPVPKDRKNRSRTGFTFTRFAIPELCGYKGRAIYLDADMLVFRDINELWTWPMETGVNLLYAQNPPGSGLSLIHISEPTRLG